MTTSDGISSEDWKRVRDLLFSLFNALQGDEESARRSDVLKYLDELEHKYGPLPSILATRADFIDDKVAKEVLLQRAYVLALDRGDQANALHIAHSLAEYYVEDAKRIMEARKWLDLLQLHLAETEDSHYADDYVRLSQMINQRDRTV